MSWADSSGSDDDDFAVPTIPGLSVAKKATWEDEDADIIAEAAARAAAPAPAPVPAHLKPKALAKKRREEAAARRAKEAEEARARLAALAPLDDPVAEKARQKRLVEEADHALTAELFADEKHDPIAEPIMKMELAEGDDYERLGAVLARKFNAAENPAYTMLFLTEFINKTEEALDANNIRDIVKVLNQVRNAKIKKESQNKKKKGKKKAKMRMSTQDDWMATETAAYDDGEDDYDFM